MIKFSNKYSKHLISKKKSKNRFLKKVKSKFFGLPSNKFYIMRSYKFYNVLY